MSYLSEKLYELRKEKKLSQEELAEKLNVARQTISKWENGITIPDTNNLLEISKIFEISIDDLICKKEDNQNELNNEIVNKNKKFLVKKMIIISIVILILVFLFILIYRMIFLFKIATNLVSAQSRDIDYQYHCQDIELKNGMTSKWEFVDAYKKDNKMIMKYYNAPIINYTDHVEAELVRIEYFDEENYYDIDLKNKTYKTCKNGIDVKSYYNLTGLKFDAVFVENFGNLSNYKDIFLCAINFENKLEINKMDNGRVVINLSKGKELTNSVQFRFIDNENNPDLSIIKKESENGIIDYNAKTYIWNKDTIDENEMLLPDLTQFICIE